MGVIGTFVQSILYITVSISEEDENVWKFVNDAPREWNHSPTSPNIQNGHSTYSMMQVGRNGEKKTQKRLILNYITIW